MNRVELLDLYYLDARARLIDVAAFLDRLDRSDGAPDFRLAAFTRALAQLVSARESRVERILTCLSDPTTEPIAVATTKAACGAPSNPQP
jgi:CRP-like cAMP-binding protein